MNELICKYCNSKNVIENENVIFCSNCNKKLELNYIDWKFKHANPNFKKFVNEFESYNKYYEAVLQEKNIVLEKKSNRKDLLKFSLSLVVIAFLFCYVIINQQNQISLFSSSQNTNYLLENKWTNYTVGDGLSITLPFELKYNETIIPQELVFYSSSVKSRRAESSRSFSVTVEEYELNNLFSENHHQFKDIQDEYILSSGNNTKQIYESDNLKIRNYITTIDHKGFIMDGEEFVSDNYTLIKGKKGIKIIVSYLKHNKLLRKFADVVNESIYKNV